MNKSNIELLFNEYQSVLSLFLTNKCNLQCAHCSVSSGPLQNSKVDVSKVLPQIINAHKYGIKALHISGGEPFLFKKNIKEICLITKDIGMATAINTNAFWATNSNSAKKLLKDIPGITQLFISTDEYHVKYLKSSRVITATREALSLGIIVSIGVCTYNGKVSNFVTALKKDLGPEILENPSFYFSVFPLEFEGRALNLKNLNFGKKRNLPTGGCNRLNRPTILEDGSVLACCNTTIAKKTNNSPLILGNINNDEIDKILSKAMDNHFIKAMKFIGPKFIVERLTDNSKKKINNLCNKHDICGLCHKIMSDDNILRDATNMLTKSENVNTLNTVANLLS